MDLNKETLVVAFILHWSCSKITAHITISQAFPDFCVGSIIDDVTVGAKIKQILHAIQVVSQHLEEYGIRLAQHKCPIYASRIM